MKRTCMDSRKLVLNSIAETEQMAKLYPNTFAELQHSTQYCGYGTVLNDMLPDRLVCGVNHSQIKQKVLSEGSSLTLEKAPSIAISIEVAIKQSLSINNNQQLSQKSNESQESVLKVNSEQKSEKLCYRCDGNHKPETCLFKEKECFYCKTKGHTIKVCHKKQKSA